MSGILYIGQEGTSGYANACKGYIYNLLKNNIKVSWTPLNFENKQYIDTCEFDEYVSAVKNKNIYYDQVIIHSTPNAWNSILSKINTKNKIVIGRTVWEFEKIPQSWIDSINSNTIDLVSVPCNWNKTIFIKNGIKKPIIVEPHIFVDFKYKKYDLDYILSKSQIFLKNSNIDIKNSYKYYTIGEFSERKGIDDTIKSFCKRFNKNDNVSLFVKTFYQNYSAVNINKCADLIKDIIKEYDHPNIIYINEQLNYDEIQSLHDLCDCYVQLTKTEGFGLGIFEALNKNKKIIVTNYGGHVEYLENKNDITFVKSKLKTFKCNTFKDKFRWAIPIYNKKIYD